VTITFQGFFAEFWKRDANSRDALADALVILTQRCVPGMHAKRTIVVGGAQPGLYEFVALSSANDEVADAKDVAVILAVEQRLSRQNLSSAIDAIAEVKGINFESNAPEGCERTMKTAFIVANTSDLTLEGLASEVRSLTVHLPSYLWPDGVAMLDRGLCNYVAHVPASSSSGDMLMPSLATVEVASPPSLYVQQFVRALGVRTIDKVMALVMKRASVFLPGLQLAPPPTIESQGMGLATETYQFNLSNHLVPMTKRQSLSGLLPQERYNFVTGSRSMGSIEYRDWQDGGVLVTSGGFPLELFLIFLAEVAPGCVHPSAQYFPGPGIQVSSVLPVSREQFRDGLRRFQMRSSNVRVERDQRQIVKQVRDEGTASPFVARLILGILSLRDGIFDPQLKLEFDQGYQRIIAALRSVRAIAVKTKATWEGHLEAVAAGKIVRMEGRALSVQQGVDDELSQQLESFINTTTRVLKKELQGLLKLVDVDIGFLFTKEDNFNRGLDALQLTDSSLAVYLADARTWLEPIISLRNALEHGGEIYSAVAYIRLGDEISAKEPKVGGVDLISFLDTTRDRVLCFVEEMVVHSMQRKVPSSLFLTEVASADRDPGAPVRFKFTVDVPPLTSWKIAPHRRSFEEA